MISMSDQSPEHLLSNITSLINSSLTLQELNDKYLQIFAGKESTFNSLTKSLSSLPQDQRKQRGEEINKAKEDALRVYEAKKESLLSGADESSEWFDITLPGKKPRVGHYSPDTYVIRKMNAFFTYHGYSIAEGPDIETDDFNFERTNLPKDHPSRDLQDTIYIESPEILLRTHTSSVETRLLSTVKPPMRFVVPGVSFRNEVLNASNHSVFYQYQGVCVDEGISMANLKATLEEFARYMYGDNVQTRFRAKHFPEVEPGGGLDILCTFCSGEGCAVCKGRGWLEILGCGMIHRNTLTKCGIDYKKWTGFAFGMGLSRIVQTQFGINDVRDLNGGTLIYENSI